MLSLKITPTLALTLTLILILTLLRTKNPIIILTHTLCCWKYNRRSNCRWSSQITTNLPRAEKTDLDKYVGTQRKNRCPNQAIEKINLNVTMFTHIILQYQEWCNVYRNFFCRALQLTDEFLTQVYCAETWFYPTLQRAFKNSIEKIYDSWTLH